MRARLPAGYMPVIDGENHGWVFDISDAGLSDPISVSLDHLTIQHGLVVNGAGGRPGEPLLHRLHQ